MEIKDILKNRRLELGMTMKELAAKCNVSEGTISRWESGAISDMRRDKIMLLANALQISPGVIMGWEEGENKQADLLSHTENQKTEKTTIPVLGRVAAGIPIEAVEDVIDYEEITETMARDGEYFALQIKGDSMEPRMKDGDVVIVRKQNNADDGDIVIATINGDDATCKVLKKYENGDVALLSLNPSYQPFYFSKQEVKDTPIQIWGKVKELRAKF